jgi:glutaredoxin
MQHVSARVSAALACVMLVLMGMTAPGAAPGDLQPQRPVQVYVFGAQQCLHCDAALQFLSRLRQDTHAFEFHDYDIVASSEAATLFARFIQAMRVANPAVPMIVIGSSITFGFENDATTGRDLRRQIDACRRTTCPDLMGVFISLQNSV